MIVMWKSGNGQNFFITANSLKRQRYLDTNSVVIKRVDCILVSDTVMLFKYQTQ